MKPTCFSCSARELTVDAVEQQLRERADRVERRAELVAHVRQEARLHLVGAPQVVGLLVELGIQRDDAAIRVLELAVEADQLVLALAQLVQRAQQLLVLLLHLLERDRGRFGEQRPVRCCSIRDDVTSRRTRRQHLLEHDLGALARRRCGYRPGPSADAHR